MISRARYKGRAIVWTFVLSAAAGFPAWLGMASGGEGPKPLIRDEMQEITATVESIDPAARTLVLVGSRGNRVLVEAGPEIHNFNQIKVGNRLVVGFHAGVAIAVKPHGAATHDIQEAVTGSRAPPGHAPAGRVGYSIETTVKIESVDTSSNTVTFKRQDGIVRTVVVEDPQARDFIRQLEPGDEVEIVYTEAIAVRVQPTSKG